MRKRTSLIWEYPESDFKQLVAKSQTMSQVLNFFGMENKGGNYVTCKTRIQELNIDSSHFLDRIKSSNFATSLTKEEFLSRLTENSKENRCHTKKYLIKFKVIPYICAKCNNNGIWNETPLSLQLEHKNGISNDNRIDNLEFLCPNCHSQTETFAGKKNKKHYFCPQCKNPTKGYSPNELCLSCSKKSG